jgi:O-antigen/teichoic acid export membrane protein
MTAQIRLFFQNLVAAAPGLRRAVLSGWMLIGMSILVQGITVPLYLSHLTSDEFGLAAMLNAFVMFSMVGAGGIWSGGIQFLGERAGLKDASGFAVAYRVTCVAYVGYGLIVCTILTVAVAFWQIAHPQLSSGEIWRTTVAVIAYLLLLYRNGVDRIALFARAEIGVANAGSMLVQAIFLPLVVLLLSLEIGLVAVPAAYFGSLCFGQLYARLHWRRARVDLSAPANTSTDWRTVVGFLFGRTGGLFQAQGALALALSSDILILGALAGPALAGEFTLLWKVAEISILALSKIPEALQPHFIQYGARGDNHDFAKLYRRALVVITGCALVGGIGYALLGPWVVGLWVGPAHVPTTDHGYALAGLTLFLVGSTRLPTIACMARRQLTSLVFLMLTEVVLKIAFILLLRDRLGAAAPLAAWSAVQILGVWGAYQVLGYQAARQQNILAATLGPRWRLVKALSKLGLRSIFLAALYRATLRLGIWPRRMPIVALGSAPSWRPPADASPTPEMAAATMEAVRHTNSSLATGKLELFGRPQTSSNSPPQWFVDPISGSAWPTTSAHWSKVDLFGANFDIKHIWDAARFWWAPALAAQARLTGSPEPVNMLNAWTKDFVERNPLHQGPLWSCAQEASIRAIHLLLATRILDQDHDPDRGVVELLTAHARRIRPTLFYAVAQMNNHAISESAALFLIGSWLCRLSDKHCIDRSEAQRWAKVGRRVLEEMIPAQIAADGCHWLRSVGYQRVVVDTLAHTEGFRRRWKLEPFSNAFYERARAAAEFLFQIVEPTSGRPPRLGTIDGSRGFDLAFVGIDDYRPSVQLALHLFGDGAPYGAGPWDAPIQWLGFDIKRTPRQRESRHFAESGYITLVAGDTWGVLILPKYHIRAGQADGLHLDVWRGATNWLADGGTYSYFSTDKVGKDVAGVWGHNTIAFDNDDQMDSRSRFLYTGWPRDVQGGLLPSEVGVAAEATMTDFRGRTHRRHVHATPSLWTISDRTSGPAREATLRWRLRDTQWEESTTGQWRTQGATMTVASSASAVPSVFGTTATSPHYGQLEYFPSISSTAPMPAEFTSRLALHDEFD